jgi:hypothetical protein
VFIAPAEVLQAFNKSYSAIAASREAEARRFWASLSRLVPLFSSDINDESRLERTIARLPDHGRLGSWNYAAIFQRVTWDRGPQLPCCVIRRMCAIAHSTRERMSQFAVILTRMDSATWCHVGSCRKGCDISKRPPTLAGLGSHPNSSQCALKEVRHAVKVRI